MVISNKKIYVKVIPTEENKNFFAFGCTGYGWVYEDELNEKIIHIQCEDEYEGHRGFTLLSKDIEVCEKQKECKYIVL